MAEDIDPRIASMLAGGSGAEGQFWNYSNPQKDGFSPVIQGTVTKISFAQEHVYGQPGVLRYWDDGNPMLLYRLHIKDATGATWLFDVRPKSGMMMEDLIPNCPGNTLMGLLGMEVNIEAEQPPVVNGKTIAFSAQNRRHYKLQVLGQGRFPSEGVDQTMPKPRQQAAPQPQAPSPQLVGAMMAGQPSGPVAQQYMAQQAAQGQMSPQLQQAMANAQASSMQRQQQQYVAAVPQQVVAQATQQTPPVDVYDQDIPF